MRRVIIETAFSCAAIMACMAVITFVSQKLNNNEQNVSVIIEDVPLIIVAGQ